LDLLEQREPLASQLAHRRFDPSPVLATRLAAPLRVRQARAISPTIVSR